MPETFVVSIKQTDTLACGDRRYTLRPITYGEAADLDRMRSLRFHGGDTMLVEIIREALRALPDDGGARHIAALDAYEEAESERTAIALTQPHAQEGPDAAAAWRRDLTAAQGVMLRAQRGRVVAESRVAEAASVQKARAEFADAERTMRDALLAMSIVDWEGPGLPDWSRDRDGPIPASVLAALPASDIEAILTRVEQLRRPGLSEKKA